MSTTAYRIEPGVQEALQNAAVSGNRLELAGQLDRKLYQRVAKAIELMGGRWDRRAKCHLFEDQAEDVVADAVATGTVLDLKKAFQFFETPVVVAQQLVRAADVRAFHSVLEPSAGRGRIVDALIDVRASTGGGIVTACEIQERFHGDLIALGRKGVEVSILHPFDFLKVPPLPVFDRIVANPPFARGQDMDHVRHMGSLLKVAGRLVSVMSPAFRFYESRRAREFRLWLDGEEIAWSWRALPADTFVESGTSVSAGVLTVDRLA